MFWKLSSLLTFQQFSNVPPKVGAEHIIGIRGPNIRAPPVRKSQTSRLTSDARPQAIVNRRGKESRASMNPARIDCDLDEAVIVVCVLLMNGQSLLQYEQGVDALLVFVDA